MTTQPLVSILIPCYNAERYIAESIESGLNQTYPNIEVIVVDDGSTDGSADVIRSYGHRIKYEIGPNQGGCAARNSAFHMSSGEYIQFNDADDLLHIDKIEKQIQLLLDGSADMVLCQGASFNDNGTAFEQGEPYPFYPEQDAFSYFLNYSYWVCLPLHKRKYVEAAGGFRPGLRRAQEMDFHLRLAAKQPRLAMVNERLVQVRQHDGPRVTDIKMRHAEMLRLFMSIGEDVRAELTESQKALLASKIHDWSSWSYRNGEEEEALEGFAYARSLARDYPINERPWVRHMSRRFSPVFAEWVLAAGRRVKYAISAGR